jgi:hypothetical protein
LIQYRKNQENPLPESPPTNSGNHITTTRKSATFVLSRDKFDQIPAYRARYILTYFAICIWWIAPKIVFLVTKTDPPHEFATIYYIIFASLYVPFYLYFSRAMRTLGFPLTWVLPTLLVVSLPIPGLLAMAYMDRKIADTWDKADDQHTKYRQKVSEQEEEDQEAQAQEE